MAKKLIQTAPIKGAANPLPPRNTYNIPFIKPNHSQAQIELAGFEINWPKHAGGVGRLEHLKNLIKLKWPNHYEKMWNHWMELAMWSLCNYDKVSWAGCGASGKTHMATLYAMCWWMVDPDNSAVILTSTSKKMIRRRQWAAFQEWKGWVVRGFPGHSVDSELTHQARPGDYKHGIYALAVESGELKKSMAQIQGIHCKRILVITDEATDTPQAIIDVTSNLRKGCQRFQHLVIGNPDSYFDPHGQFSEPKNGWSSITIDDESWETLDGGICIHFDGTDSPNLRIKEDKWPYLIGNKDVAKAIHKEGEGDYRFWKYTRGFWCPEGNIHRVITEQLCLKFNAMNKEMFHSKSMTIAGLDPAFEGDRCVLKFAKIGDRSDGSQFVHFYKTVIIRIQATDQTPASYQIAQQVVNECIKEDCKPNHLAVDMTGNGIAVCDAIGMLWGSAGSIIKVGFGEAASDLPVSPSNAQKSKDAYENKVTELWMSMRQMIEHDRIRGLDAETIKEFSKRNVETKNRKQQVEPKREMKKKTNVSPDLADAASLVIEVARRIGVSPSGKRRSKSWENAVKQNQQLYEGSNAEAA